jgi:uncharacterized protein (TIGR02246 family)
MPRVEFLRAGGCHDYNPSMMRFVLALCCAPLLFGQKQDIEKLLKDSESAWNRGDLAAFASYYDDSPETTFIGREVVRGGTAAILDRYRRAYPTREAMGELTFSEIAVRPLAEGVALATGKYTLHRSVAGGGEASGRFTLILRKTSGGWKIIHDHTSSS